MIGDILGKWYDLEKKIDSVRWMKGMVNNSAKNGGPAWGGVDRVVGALAAKTWQCLASAKVEQLESETPGGEHFGTVTPLLALPPPQTSQLFWRGSD